MARRRFFLPALLLVVLAGCGEAAPDVPLYRAIVAKPAPTTTTTTPPQVAAETVSRGPALWPVVDTNIQLAGPPFQAVDVTVPKIGIYDSPTTPTPSISM